MCTYFTAVTLQQYVITRDTWYLTPIRTTSSYDKMVTSLSGIVSIKPVVSY